MPESRLTIIDTTSKKQDPTYESSRNARSRELQAKFERIWLVNPERFNPLRNCLERERLDRTWNLMKKHSKIVGKRAVDIGCAGGVFSRRMRDAGAIVESVDIAENALKKFRELGADQIELRREVMPLTQLHDQCYEIVVCTDVIAEVPKEDYRLFFAELSRIITTDGILVFSSPIDIATVGGIDRLIELAQSEFDIIEDAASYHALYLRCKRILKTPFCFIDGWKNPNFRKAELDSRRGLSRAWFWLNSSPLLVWFWYSGKVLMQPFLKLLNNNKSLLLRLEKMSRFLWDQDGISHYFFVAKRRPLQRFNPEDIPLERPKRKEVWD